jgi:hypothetical protein
MEQSSAEPVIGAIRANWDKVIHSKAPYDQNAAAAN